MMYSSTFIYSGSDVETQKTASKQKKKVQRQHARSKSDSKETRKKVSSINHNVPVSSNNTAIDDRKDDLEDLTLSVYSPEDGLMTSMRVSSILENASKERCHASRSILSNQMYSTQGSNATKQILEAMPSLTSKQGNPNFLALARIQETQEELYGPMKYYRRSSSKDVRHFTDSVEFGVPTTVNALNSDHLLERAFSKMRERTVFEC